MNCVFIRKCRSVVGTYFSLQDIRATFKLLGPFIMKYRVAYCVLLLLLAVDILLTLSSSWIFGEMTDAVVRGEQSRIQSLMLLGGGIVLVRMLSTFADTVLEEKATSGVIHSLKEYLLQHLLLLPVSTVSRYNTGELLSHFHHDIGSVGGVIGRSLINLVRLPIIYVAVLAYLVHLHWKLALLALLVAPVALGSGVLFGLVLRRSHRRIHQLVGTISQLQTEVLQGYAVVRSFTLEQAWYRKFVEYNQALYALFAHNAKLRGWFFAGGAGISSLTFLASLGLGAYFVAEGDLSVGALITYLMLVNHLIYPLTGLAGQWAGFQRSVSAVERLTRVLAQPKESDKLPASIKPNSLEDGIRFTDVSFSYEGETRVLDRLNLRIPAGSKVAIVGQSGAGKTTLFYLLLRYFKPLFGRIELDRVPIDQWDPEALRSTIAYVPQDTYLFSGTIRDNLMLARPDLTEQEMIHAAQTAQIHDAILSLPRGYDTEVGERGLRLSGGQKQRIAIARAILKDAPILLLDEATSALDAETEEAVLGAIATGLAARTILIISHRLSTIRHADTIMVMREGRMIAAGAHNDLLEHCLYYRELVNMKLGQQEEVGEIPSLAATQGGRGA